MNTAPLDGSTGRSTLLQPGEILLAVGFILFAFTIAVMHFVMGVFLAVIPGGISAPLLVIGMLRTRDKAGQLERQVPGAVLLIAGMLILLVVAFKSGGLSWQLAISGTRQSFPGPSPQQLLGVSAAWFLPALLGYPGTALWTNWSRSRRVFWCFVAVVLSPAVMVLHQLLAALGFPLYA